MFVGETRLHPGRADEAEATLRARLWDARNPHYKGASDYEAGSVVYNVGASYDSGLRAPTRMHNMAFLPNPHTEFGLLLPAAPACNDGTIP